MQVHFLSRRMVYLGLILLKHLPCNIVDSLMVMLSKFVYGDLTKYGINRPSEGPFFMKVKYGKYPVIDVGTYEKIKSREIQVCATENNKKRKKGFASILCILQKIQKLYWLVNIKLFYTCRFWQRK